MIDHAHKLYRNGAEDTSVAAARSLNLTAMESRVLEAVSSFGPQGCTQDQVLALLSGTPYSSVTARFRALLDRSEIIDTGERRKGLSGRAQRVLRVK